MYIHTHACTHVNTYARRLIDAAACTNAIMSEDILSVILL